MEYDTFLAAVQKLNGVWYFSCCHFWAWSWQSSFKIFFFSIKCIGLL